MDLNVHREDRDERLDLRPGETVLAELRRDIVERTTRVPKRDRITLTDQRLILTTRRFPHRVRYCSVELPDISAMEVINRPVWVKAVPVAVALTTLGFTIAIVGDQKNPANLAIGMLLCMLGLAGGAGIAICLSKSSLRIAVPDSDYDTSAKDRPKHVFFDFTRPINCSAIGEFIDQVKAQRDAIVDQSAQA